MKVGQSLWKKLNYQVNKTLKKTLNKKEVLGLILKKYTALLVKKGKKNEPVTNMFYNSYKYEPKDMF